MIRDLASRRRFPQADVALPRHLRFELFLEARRPRFKALDVELVLALSLRPRGQPRTDHEQRCGRDENQQLSATLREEQNHGRADKHRRDQNQPREGLRILHPSAAPGR
ncbi:hypothetical protein [Microcella putealis]|uniref:hypothetical protein n=1 Tax=Microcella putealis TaxID=337005 RepID=UPI0021AB81E1|nr:hypothetical protein [Microcella putealis]